MTEPNLLILDGSRYPTRSPNPAYRGTFRASPGYFNSLPQDHEANTLFLWFLEEGGELGVVHDKAKACRLRDFCNSHGSGGTFELVEATEGEKQPLVGEKFLGFDLSQGFNNSLLWSGLNRQVPGDPESPVRVLANTIFRLFSKELNANGLLSSIETAMQCRTSLIALQALEPNLLEGDELEKFVVVGVFLVQ
jgi:hypothetical protein